MRSFVPATRPSTGITGFEIGPYGEQAAEDMMRQLGLSGELRFTPVHRQPSDRRAHFAASLLEVTKSTRDKLVVVLAAPGYSHDITLATARLATDPSVLMTAVIEPARSRLLRKPGASRGLRRPNRRSPSTGAPRTLAAAVDATIPYEHQAVPPATAISDLPPQYP